MVSINKLIPFSSFVITTSLRINGVHLLEMAIINGLLIIDKFLMGMISYAMNILRRHNKSKVVITIVNFFA
jgi:hypothetical protein